LTQSENQNRFKSEGISGDGPEKRLKRLNDTLVFGLKKTLQVALL
jgi:hypothetical protein